MEIIITDFFEKQCKKNVKDISIGEMCNKINVESKNFIDLHQPYFKIKLRSKNKSYRLLVAYDKKELIILCVNIFDKKDKKNGHNISWQRDKEKIIFWRNKGVDCIKQGKYYKIEI